LEVPKAVLRNAKLILTAIAILIAAVIVWFVVGLVVKIVMFALFVAVILLAVKVFRKIAGKSEPKQIEEDDTDRELNESLRQLEEIKRKQLIK
jgi:membrane protein implicated in regulation of membrane protease activity